VGALDIAAVAPLQCRFDAFAIDHNLGDQPAPSHTTPSRQLVCQTHRVCGAARKCPRNNPYHLALVARLRNEIEHSRLGVRSRWSPGSDHEGDGTTVQHQARLRAWPPRVRHRDVNCLGRAIDQSQQVARGLVRSNSACTCVQDARPHSRGVVDRTAPSQVGAGQQPLPFTRGHPRPDHRISDAVFGELRPRNDVILPKQFAPVSRFTSKCHSPTMADSLDAARQPCGLLWTAGKPRPHFAPNWVTSSRPAHESVPVKCIGRRRQGGRRGGGGKADGGAAAARRTAGRRRQGGRRGGGGGKADGGKAGPREIGRRGGSAAQNATPRADLRAPLRLLRAFRRRRRSTGTSTHRRRR